MVSSNFNSIALHCRITLDIFLYFKRHSSYFNMDKDFLDSNVDHNNF